MLSAITYYFDRLRFPGVGDFISMGLGIEARYRRCAGAWEPHLRLTRGFLEGALEGVAAGARVAILGAGRLFDVPVERLRAAHGELHLFDADPGCLRCWRRRFGRGSSLVPHIGDVTGSIDRWTRAAASFVGGSPDEVSAGIDALQVGEAPNLDRFDLIVSLNLLSQIPIYWRDRFEGLTGTDLFEHAAVTAALERSYGRLQAAHLQMLNRSNAARIVLITDERFFYYRNDLAPWQEERSLYLPSLDLPDYTLHRHDSWYWHIIPQGVEESDFGSIHAVCAREWRR